VVVILVFLFETKKATHFSRSGKAIVEVFFITSMGVMLESLFPFI